MRNSLLDIGGWLKQNGEATYGTTPWKIYGEGPTQIRAGFGHDKDTTSYQASDFRFTQKGQTLYAIEMAWPSDGRALICSLGSKRLSQGLQIASVELLGTSAKLDWRQTEDALEVKLPDSIPGEYAYVFRIQIGSTQDHK